MSEATTAVLDEPQVLYRVNPKEIRLHQETGKLQSIKGSPRIWYVDIGGNSAGIFKSRHNEKKIISDVQNERAAYLISEIVGFDFVPITVLRTIEGREGSLQEFVEGAQSMDEVPSLKIRDELYKFWIFRHILRNPDGHDDNLLIKDGRIISVDHEASFDSDPPDPSYFDIDRSYYGVKAPDSLIEIFKKFLNDKTKPEILRAQLQNLISTKDIEITLERLKVIGEILIKKGYIASKEELGGKDLW